MVNRCAIWVDWTCDPKVCMANVHIECESLHKHWCMDIFYYVMNLCATHISMCSVEFLYRAIEFLLKVFCHLVFLFILWDNMGFKLGAFHVLFVSGEEKWLMWSIWIQLLEQCDYNFIYKMPIMRMCTIKWPQRAITAYKQQPVPPLPLACTSFLTLELLPLSVLLVLLLQSSASLLFPL